MRNLPDFWRAIANPDDIGFCALSTDRLFLTKPKISFLSPTDVGADR